MDLTAISAQFWDKVRDEARKTAHQVVDQRMQNQPSGGANISITTGATGIPLVGDPLITSPQAFVRVPFPFQLQEVYTCLDVADEVEWTIRVFYPTEIGGTGWVGGLDPTGGTSNVANALDNSFDPKAVGWANTFFPAGSNVALYILQTGGLAGIITLNLVGRVVVR